MADSTTPTTTSDVLAAIVQLLKTGADPETLEAQRIVLRRLALQGDVVVSRIPPPRNITEIGGYLNLLADLSQSEMRTQMLSGLLGVAGPAPSLGFTEPLPPIAFVNVDNDRPNGPVQPSIPTSITIRSDMLVPFLAARQALHDTGCTLPLLTPARALPRPGQGGEPIPDLLRLLGRTLDIVPAAVLAEPDNDPVAIAHLASDPSGAFQLVAREIDGGTLIAEQSWQAIRCDGSLCSVDAAALHRYRPLAPVLAPAGWYPVSPVVMPSTVSRQGSFTRFLNVTSLVVGVTRLLDELSLLYPQTAIATSSLVPLLSWVWNGLRFVAN